MNDDDRLRQAWLDSLAGLNNNPEAAQRWREVRFSFAFRLGEKLVAGATQASPTAIYGIWLPWGLLYVGQTEDAVRRLRDLPVGESHHLANTFPPEIWDRVVVIYWGSLPEADEAVERLGQRNVGLALEYRLQTRLRPLVNACRRTATGRWKPVDWVKSKSRGAKNSAALGALGDRVDSLWDQGALYEEGDPMPDSMNCVRPARLV